MAGKPAQRCRQAERRWETLIDDYFSSDTLFLPRANNRRDGTGQSRHFAAMTTTELRGQTQRCHSVGGGWVQDPNKSWIGCWTSIPRSRCSLLAFHRQSHSQNPARAVWTWRSCDIKPAGHWSVLGCWDIMERISQICLERCWIGKSDAHLLCLPKWIYKFKTGLGFFSPHLLCKHPPRKQNQQVPQLRMLNNQCCFSRVGCTTAVMKIIYLFRQCWLN